MAKQTEKTEKKEFAWDTEVKIGEFGDSKERHTVNICTLNGKTYVQDVKEVMTQKNGWKLAKRTSLTMDVFKELQDMVGRWELDSAFGSDSAVKVVEKPKKELTAMRGRKLSVREQLERNENFSKLPQAKQAKLLATVSTIIEDYGKASVMLSKTDFRAINHSNGAEKELRAIRGYTKGQYSIITN